MEQITKQQLILVSLLVSIVTAVATSVATVSLTDGSGRPEQTIYKVIEKSIEKVTDIPTVKNIVGKEDLKTTTSELSPSDIVETKSKSLVRVYEVVGEEKKFVALGLSIGAKDRVLTSSLASPYIPESSKYIAILADGRQINLKYEKGGLTGDFNLFTLQYDANEKTKVQPLTVKGISTVKLGSNVVALGGKESGDVLSTGIVTEMRSLDMQASSTKQLLLSDMNLTSQISGWLLFDTMGGLIAFEKGFDEVGHEPVFVNAKLLEAEIKEYL